MADEKQDDAKSRGEENSTRLLDAICDLENVIGASEFKENAREVQELFNTLRPLSPSDREALWARYQEAWNNHKAHLARRWEESEELFQKLGSRIDYGLDLSPDGLIFGSEMFGRADWEGMGAKLSEAKSILDEVESTIRSDSRLQPKHRHELFQKLHDKRYKLQQARDNAWSVLHDRCEELYNETHSAIETMPPREALHVFKENQQIVMSLYLNPDDKDKFRGWFQELWQKLQASFEEKHREYEQRRNEWRTRQEAGLERLLTAKEKLEAYIEKLEDNIEANQSRQASARSSDFEDVVGEWIREGEEKLEDARQSLGELNRKIEDAERHLQGSQ